MDIDLRDPVVESVCFGQQEEEGPRLGRDSPVGLFRRQDQDVSGKSVRVEKQKKTREKRNLFGQICRRKGSVCVFLYGA